MPSASLASRDQPQAASKSPRTCSVRGAVGERLRQLAARDLAGGHEHERRQAGLRGVGGERRPGVAGRRAGDRVRADASRLRHADGHPAVLERAGRVLALVLEQQAVDAGPAVEGVALQQRRVALGVRDHVVRRRQHDLAEPPHARRQRSRTLPAPLGEALDQLGGRQRRRPCWISSSPPQSRSGDADRARSVSLPQAMHLPARRTLRLESHRCPPVTLDQPCSDPVDRRHPRRRSAALRGVRRDHGRGDSARRDGDLRARARRPSGPLPEIELPSAPASSAARFASREAGKQRRARRLGDAIVDRAAEQLVVAGWRARPPSRPPAPPDARRSRARPRRAARHARRAVRMLLVGPRPATTMSSSGTGSCTMSIGSHASGSARCRRAATARCCRDGDPRRVSSATRHAASERRPVERRAEQRVRRDRARHGRGRAAALAARERQALSDRERDAAASARATQFTACEHRAGGERRGVTGRIAGKGRDARDRAPDARRSRPLGAHLVAGAVHGEPQDVEPGAEIADAAGGERGDRPGALIAPASRRMSFSTPAAVTSAPAPGPVMTSGLAL